MRIALFSDVHANLPALEAVLEDIQSRGIDMIFCLGDLVSYAPWPNEVIELIRERKIATIAGNHDEILGNKVAAKFISDPSKSIGQVSIDFTNSILKSENREYLKALPKHIRLDFSEDMEGSSLSLLLVHGSPEKIDEYLKEDLSDPFYLNLLEKNKANILCFGHTHKPFHKTLVTTEEEKQVIKHAINLGSVGKPKDGNPRACYVVLYLHSAPEESHEVLVEFVRVKYDVEKTASAIESSPLPNEFANMLRKAF